MGKATNTQPYRDDPEAVSLHTTPEYHDDDDDDNNNNADLLSQGSIGPSSGSDNTGGPPSYHDSETIASAERDNQARAARVDQFTDRYSVKRLAGWRQETNGKKGSTAEVWHVIDPRLDQPDELFAYIDRFQQWKQPNPTVWLTGYHYHTTYTGKDKREREKVTDFDITLSLRPYLVPPGSGEGEWRLPRVAGAAEQTYRGGWRKTRAPVGSGNGSSRGSTTREEEEEEEESDVEAQGVGLLGPEPEREPERERDLRAWVQDYCASPAALKVFRIARTCSGLDEPYLASALERLVRQTQYCGTLDVQVVVEERGLDVYSSHWVNRWRTSWVRFLFYLTFLWIFTWPVLFFCTRRWRVFTVDWPFSVPWPERGLGVRRYATISEKEWVAKHAELIKGLVLDRFQGETDCVSLETGQRHRQGARLPGNTGNANVDSAVNLIQAGVSGWNAIQRGMGRDVDGWGHDD